MIRLLPTSYLQNYFYCKQNKFLKHWVKTVQILQLFKASYRFTTNLCFMVKKRKKIVFNC